MQEKLLLHATVSIFITIAHASRRVPVVPESDGFWSGPSYDDYMIADDYPAVDNFSLNGISSDFYPFDESESSPLEHSLGDVAGGKPLDVLQVFPSVHSRGQWRCCYCQKTYDGEASPDTKICLDTISNIGEEAVASQGCSAYCNYKEAQYFSFYETECTLVSRCAGVSPSSHAAEIVRIYNQISLGNQVAARIRQLETERDQALAALARERVNCALWIRKLAREKGVQVAPVRGKLKFRHQYSLDDYNGVPSVPDGFVERRPNQFFF